MVAALPPALDAHLKSGLTTLCRAWAITRTDGVAMGFTDHDLPLSFKGVTFKADTGLSSSTLSQGTGLSVDNVEAVGVLSDASITDEDIEAGRYDGAQVSSWLVNWQDVNARWLMFEGSIGEIRRAGGAFTAELRGLTDTLNRTIGRVYQKSCSAVPSDPSFRFDMMTPGYFFETNVQQVAGGLQFTWDALVGFEPGWFTRGRLDVLTGAAAGLWGSIKEDRSTAGTRVLELWESLRLPVAPGDRVRIFAGYDKRFETCRDKFNNTLNFQGFPDLPGEDWMTAVPKKAGVNTGGSRR